MVSMLTAFNVCFVGKRQVVRMMVSGFYSAPSFRPAGHGNAKLYTSCQYVINSGPISKFAFSLMAGERCSL